MCSVPWETAEQKHATETEDEEETVEEEKEVGVVVVH